MTKLIFVFISLFTSFVFANPQVLCNRVNSNFISGTYRITFDYGTDDSFTAPVQIIKLNKNIYSVKDTEVTAKFKVIVKDGHCIFFGFDNEYHGDNGPLGKVESFDTSRSFRLVLQDMESEDFRSLISR